MSLSGVNTNTAAMTALQGLNLTSRGLQQAQSRISTGKRVAVPKDNGAIWAVAQGQRSQLGSLNAVKESLGRAQTIVDVALSAGTQILDILDRMKELATLSADITMYWKTRASLSENFTTLRDQIAAVVESSSFDGFNLFKAGSADLKALANLDGSSVITVSAVSLALGGATITVTPITVITGPVSGRDSITTVQNSINNLSAVMARFGTKSRALNAHYNSITKLQDDYDAAIGNLVDADMVKESAKIQALQTKRLLGTQSLSIANQSPSILRSLFR